MKDTGASLHKHREGLRRAIVLDIFQAQKADSGGRILRLSLFHDEPTNQINRRLAAQTHQHGEPRRNLRNRHCRLHDSQTRFDKRIHRPTFERDSQIRRHRADPLAAGREQQVDYVLASNYQLAGGKIRITAQLFNVASGQIEETYKSEKDAGDVFAMQDAVASEVGNILSARFAVTSSGASAKRGTSNEEAYRLYLQGMYLVDQRGVTNGRKAVELLEQAVRLDPNYAQAWAGKAHAHRLIVNSTPSGAIDDYQKSIEAINKALALDENLADAHSALCENKMYYEYDFDAAERSCKRAIELAPNSSLAHQVYSRYLVTRGRIDEGIAEIKTAIDLEPTSRFNQRWYGNCLMFARRYAESVAQLKRVIAMDASFGTTYSLSATLGKLEWSALVAGHFISRAPGRALLTRE